MSAKPDKLMLLVNFILGAATKTCRQWTSSEGFLFLFLNFPVPLNTAKLLFFSTRCWWLGCLLVLQVFQWKGHSTAESESETQQFHIADQEFYVLQMKVWFVQHGNCRWKKMKERVIILQEGKEIIRTFDGYYRRQSMKIIAIPANL